MISNVLGGAKFEVQEVGEEEGGGGRWTGIYSNHGEKFVLELSEVYYRM